MSRGNIPAIVGAAANAAATGVSGNTSVPAPSLITRFAPDGDVWIATGGAGVTVTAANGVKVFGGMTEYFDTSGGYFAVLAVSGVASVNYVAIVAV